MFHTKFPPPPNFVTPYVQAQPGADKQVLVIVSLPHIPQVALHVPAVHADHVPPGGQVAGCGPHWNVLFTVTRTNGEQQVPRGNVQAGKFGQFVPVDCDDGPLNFCQFQFFKNFNCFQNFLRART